MPALATTRFNTKTWQERQHWMQRNHLHTGCIYGTPIKTKETIADTLIVLEMHNDENKLMAISLIKNRAVLSDKTHQIYQDRNYNRYIYKSPYRLLIDEIELTEMEKKIIAILTQLLFKGACHSKRAQGITEMPAWIMRNKRVDFLKSFRDILTRYYKREI